MNPWVATAVVLLSLTLLWLAAEIVAACRDAGKRPMWNPGEVASLPEVTWREIEDRAEREAAEEAGDQPVSGDLTDAIEAELPVATETRAVLSEFAARWDAAAVEQDASFAQWQREVDASFRAAVATLGCGVS